jgi:hypothetical protein
MRNLVAAAGFLLAASGCGPPVSEGCGYEAYVRTDTCFRHDGDITFGPGGALSADLEGLCRHSCLDVFGRVVLPQVGVSYRALPLLGKMRYIANLQLNGSSTGRFDGLEHLEEVEVLAGRGHSSLQGLSSLSKAAGLTLEGRELTSLAGLPDSALVSSLTLTGTRVTSLGDLRVSGIRSFFFAGNTMLASLDGPAWASEMPGFRLLDTSVTSLAPLSRVTRVTTQMLIDNNRQLKQCEVDAFIARVGPTRRDELLVGQLAGAVSLMEAAGVPWKDPEGSRESHPSAP